MRNVDRRGLKTDRCPLRFKGLEKLSDVGTADVPAEWLKALSEIFLTEEEKKMIEEMGGFDKMMEMLAERMKDHAEQMKTLDARIASLVSGFGEFIRRDRAPE